MKYLKLYEIFKINIMDTDGKKISYNATSEFEQTLREICLELEDIGYNIVINKYWDYAIAELEKKNSIIINKPSETLPFIQI